MPQLTLLAGTNGSKKTSFFQKRIKSLAQRHNIEFVNADFIAKELSEKANGNYEDFNIRAGRITIGRINSLFAQKKNFIFETTFSQGNPAKLFSQAKSLAYKTNLIFIGTSNPFININRVSLRVLDGEHFVAKDIITRRYSRSINNLHKFKNTVDRCWIIDNSKNKHCVVCRIELGEIKFLSLQLPNWLLDDNII